MSNLKENFIEIANVSKNYSGIKALKNVSINLESGRIIGLLGPNGSGKTTLIKILTGIIKNYTGSVSIGGMEIGVQTKEIVAYLPDKNIFMPWWTLSDALMYYIDFFKDFDKEKAIRLVEKLGINPKQKFKTLSKGTKDKLQLILTLSRKAKIYIFDEPIAGVDPAAREFIFKLILQEYNKDATILISTHLAIDVEPILDDVIFLHNGVIKLFSSKDNLIENYQKSIDQIFREVFRC